MNIYNKVLQTKLDLANTADIVELSSNGSPGALNALYSEIIE